MLIAEERFSHCGRTTIDTNKILIVPSLCQYLLQLCFLGHVAYFLISTKYILTSGTRSVMGRRLASTCPVLLYHFWTCASSFVFVFLFDATLPPLFLCF